MKTKQKQSRETGNIGCTRQRKTKQKQSRETGNKELVDDISLTSEVYL
jgi:hypothetical protein